MDLSAELEALFPPVVNDDRKGRLATLLALPPRFNLHSARDDWLDPFQFGLWARLSGVVGKLLSYEHSFRVNAIELVRHSVLFHVRVLFSDDVKREDTEFFINGAKMLGGNMGGDTFSWVEFLLNRVRSVLLEADGSLNPAKPIPQKMLADQVLRSGLHPSPTYVYAVSEEGEVLLFEVTAIRVPGMIGDRIDLHPGTQVIRSIVETDLHFNNSLERAMVAASREVPNGKGERLVLWRPVASWVVGSKKPMVRLTGGSAGGAFARGIAHALTNNGLRSDPRVLVIADLSDRSNPHKVDNVGMIKKLGTVAEWNAHWRNAQKMFLFDTIAVGKKQNGREWPEGHKNLSNEVRFWDLEECE